MIVNHISQSLKVKSVKWSTHYRRYIPKLDVKGLLILQLVVKRQINGKNVEKTSYQQFYKQSKNFVAIVYILNVDITGSDIQHKKKKFDTETFTSSKTKTILGQIVK